MGEGEFLGWGGRGWEEGGKKGRGREAGKDLGGG